MWLDFVGEDSAASLGGMTARHVAESAQCVGEPNIPLTSANRRRAEFHRLRGAAHTKPRRDVGSRVFQVFEGAGHIRLGEHSHAVSRDDLIVVPSWVPWSLQADTEFDLFMFSDAPIVESLHFHHTLTSKGA